MIKIKTKLVLGIFIVAVLATGFFIAPKLSDATETYNKPFTAPTAPTDKPALGTRTLFSTINPILAWVFGIIGIICVAFIVTAGIGIATSAGNEEKRRDSIKTLTWSLIGLVIVLAAYAIVALVGSGLEAGF